MGANFTTVAEAMRQHEALGYATTAADAYRQAQYPQQTELEKTIALMSGSVSTAMGHFDRASADTALGLYHHPTSREMFEQIERERLEKSLVEMERHERIIEFTPPPFYDHQAAINRQRESDREHAIETARLAEIARLEARDEYEARKQTASTVPLKVAPTKRQTWRDVAMVYVLGVYKAGQYATTKDFYKALLGKAGTDDSPFQKGTGANSGSLFVQVISKPLSLKALENAMPEIRQAAK